MSATLREPPLTIEEDTETILDEPLSQADLEALEAETTITVSLDSKGQVSVDPGRQIGLLGLPSGRIIEIKPKVGFNLLYYLAFAGRIDEALVQGRDVGIDTGESFVDLIAHLFITESDRILRRGLYQEYRTQTAMERYLRGRLDITRQLTAHGPVATKLACEFDELTHDLPINHLLAQAVDVLQPLVSTRRLESDLRRTRGRLRQHLEVVPRQQVDPGEITITRQTSHYREALALCELVFGETYVESLGAGIRDFQSVLISTNDLFEHVVYRAVERCLDRTVYRMNGDGNPDRTNRRDIGYLLESSGGQTLQKLYPDVFVTNRATGEYVLISDAKWKDPDTGRPSREDLYQLTTYQSKVDAPVLLVYPDLGGSISDTYSYLRPEERNGDSTFRVCELEASGAQTYAGFEKRVQQSLQPVIDELLSRG